MNSDSVMGYFREQLTGGAVTADIQSNIFPGFSVYDSNAPEGGADILGLLGVKIGVVIRGASGNQLYSVGNPAPLDPVRAALVWGVVGFLGAALVRGLIK